jgi:DNA topoisomerase-1
VAKNLVIVESPGKIKTIGKVLGKNYTVKASIGHIRDLPKGKGKGADSSKLIVAGIAKDFTPTYVNVEAKKKVIAELRKAAMTFFLASTFT